VRKAPLALPQALTQAQMARLALPQVQMALLLGLPAQQCTQMRTLL
jgi:hypothetical protein